MLIAGVPPKFTIPWGNGAGSGFIRAIPTASQIGLQLGAASLTDGLPPACFSPIAAGGSWPFGQDFNGILNQITKWNQWQQAGGPITYDAAFSAAIGGYPKGTLLSAASLGFFWLSTIDNNTSDPDTGGEGWINPFGGRLVAIQTFYDPGVFTYTPTPGVTRIRAMVVGGGASGGSNGTTANLAAGGGGAGGFADWYGPNAVAQTITVGAGGAAQTPNDADGGYPGNPGGTSSFGSIASATGGQGGGGALNGNAGGGSPGAGVGGTANGGSGGFGGDGIGDGTISLGGNGGSSIFGGSGRASTASGVNAGAPGAGGGGAYGAPNTYSGAGAAGCVIIEEYL